MKSEKRIIEFLPNNEEDGKILQIIQFNDNGMAFYLRLSQEEVIFIIKKYHENTQNEIRR